MRWLDVWCLLIRLDIRTSGQRQGKRFAEGLREDAWIWRQDTHSYPPKFSDWKMPWNWTVSVGYMAMCVYLKDFCSTNPRLWSVRSGRHARSWLLGNGLTQPWHYFCFHLLPRNLTWNLKMMVSKSNHLFQVFLFRFHVKLQGCTFHDQSLFWIASLRCCPSGNEWRGNVDDWGHQCS